MRVLWICNLILPEIATYLGLPYLPKEGWVEGLLGQVMDREDLQIAMAFPISKEHDGSSGEVELNGHPGRTLPFFGFYEDTGREEYYDPSLEQRMEQILDSCRPDLVHCFGTEFPHALAMARAVERRRTGGKAEGPRLLITLQGLCGEIGEKYMAQLPEQVQRSRTFRDLVRRDSLKQQQQKYRLRGEHERQALAIADRIGGRTEFDHSYANTYGSRAEYFPVGEILRASFYEERGEVWEPEKSHFRIFVSQADYPLKGLHYLLRAVKDFAPGGQSPEIYVAGQSIVHTGGWRDRIKEPAYGRYLRKLIRETGMEGHVHFLGRISGEEMRRQYLSASVYVCCSSCENSPNSLAEAMMLGVPCIAAAVGGIPSMLADGRQGWLYRNEPEDSEQQVAEALRRCLAEVAENPEEAARRGKQGAVRARLDHDREKIVSQLLAAYGVIGQ